MDELFAAIYALVSNTPPERIAQIAQAVRELPGPASSAQLNTWAPTPAAKTRLDQLTTAWSASPITPLELAGMLRGAADAYTRARAESHTELVWTGPSSELVPTRKTEQALLQVIEAAQARLFLTTFVTYDVALIMAALTKAADRGVALSMLLESSEQQGGSTFTDGIAQMRKALPTASIYSWKDKDAKFTGGKVHAKVAVCDEAFCFISSANLTGHAMEKNMEAGVLIQGGPVPKTLHRHLEALVTIKVVRT